MSQSEKKEFQTVGVEPSKKGKGFRSHYLKENPGAWRKRRGGHTVSDLTKAKGVLSKVLAFRGLDKKIERYGFVLQWEKIVGTRLAEVTRPEFIRNRTLIVSVLHSTWAQELTMMKPTLIRSLAHYLQPGDIVRDMVFQVRDFHTVVIEPPR
jgi:predicted nucleic acid-binding Zn ribbon protein